MNEKYRNLFINALKIIGFIILAYLMFRYLFKWFLPFIVATIISYITNPIVTFLEKKLKIPRKVSSALTILVFVSSIGGLLGFLIYRIVFEFIALAEQLPSLLETTSQQLNDLFYTGLNLYIKLPSEVTVFLDNALSNITNSIYGMIQPITASTTRTAVNFAKSLPSALIFLIITLVSTYFISSDKDKIMAFFNKTISKKIMKNFLILKSNLIGALLGYIRAQGILMCITFIELTIGLAIIGIPYTMAVAFFISIIDALPILGTGTVLIPWAIFSLITGNYKVALSLLILYGVILLVRQLLEPKIVGTQIGLYPLITLMCMYVGLSLFGIAGMILGPITFLVLKSLYQLGLFKRSVSTNSTKSNEDN